MAYPLYRFGSCAVPVGVLDFTVGGLALPFEPSSVVLGIRKPDSNSAFLMASLVGTPTADGFAVELSSDAGEGYLLDWTAYAPSVKFSGDSLALGYDDFFEGVRKFLGYPAKDKLTDEQKSEVDSYVQDGVRQFYYPQMVSGIDAAHQWSFLRQEGSLQTSAGVMSVKMPDGFIRIIGNLCFPSTVHRPPIAIVPEFKVRESIARDSKHGIPRVCAIRHRNDYGDAGQLCEALLFPIPDAAYSLTFCFEGDGGKLSSDLRPYPLGGSRFANVIMESCLSVAEQKANDEVGIHSKHFQELLASAVTQDCAFGPANYGPMDTGSPELEGFGRRRHYPGSLTITHNGEVI